MSRNSSAFVARRLPDRAESKLPVQSKQDIPVSRFYITRYQTPRVNDTIQRIKRKQDNIYQQTRNELIKNLKSLIIS